MIALGTTFVLSEIDTVASAKRYGDRRAFDILMEAQYYWNQMEDFRKDRERNKRYTYGFQWDDMICVDGKSMTEEEYIKSQVLILIVRILRII